MSKVEKHVFPRTEVGFRRARDEARRLAARRRLTSAAAYKEIGANGLSRFGLPANPDRAWPELWRGWADWLGNCDRPQNLTSDRWFMPFSEARKVGRSSPATSIRSWKAWVRDEREAGRCTDVPVNPDLVYEEWAGWTDWLGG